MKYKEKKVHSRIRKNLSKYNSLWLELDTKLIEKLLKYFFRLFKFYYTVSKKIKLHKDLTLIIKNKDHDKE